jgi:hypothetical protein
MSAIEKEIEGLGKEVSNFDALIPGDLEKVDDEELNSDVDSSTEDTETTLYPMFPVHFVFLPIWIWDECQAQETWALRTNLMLKVKGFLLRLLIAILIALRSLAKGYGLGTLCSEYAHRRRPLCTTMPWNIWPALVVLWGVCWMFYGSPQITDSTWMDLGLGKPHVL